MTEAKGRMVSTRAETVGVHLAVIGLSLFLSLIVLRWIDPFPGQAIDAMVFSVLFTHIVATIVALLIPNMSKVTCVIVFAIAFSCTGCFGLDALQKARYLRYYAAYDRFQDHLASPVPKSVSNLSFVSVEEGISADLMFQFDIDPADMDAILKSLQLEKVDPAKMLNPKDFFQYPYYMPIVGGYHVFQGKDKFGEVLTIKTNESHSHAIFRKESSNIYRDRRWESGNPTILQMDNEALERLKIQHGK